LPRQGLDELFEVFVGHHVLFISLIRSVMATIVSMFRMTIAAE
jgi:hypothetical protein